jgi:hypothetical protein
MVPAATVAQNAAAGNVYLIMIAPYVQVRFGADPDTAA